MAFTDLTAFQQIQIMTLDASLVRPALVAARKALAGMQMAVDQYNATGSAVLATLQQTDTINYTGGLNGAVPVTVAQLEAMITAFSQLLAAWNTDAVRQQHAVFVGGANLNG